MIRTIAIALGAAFAAAVAPAGWAQCPPQPVQDMVGLDLQVAKAASLEEVAAKADALAKACASDAYVQRVAAIVHTDINTRMTDAASAWPHAVKAWEYVLAMRATAPPNEKPVLVMANGAPIEVRIYGPGNFDQEMLLNLISTEMATGKFIPDHAPLAANEKLRACTGWDAAHAQYAATIAGENLQQHVAPVLNFLDRAARMCNPAESINSRIIAVRARLIVKMVKANSKRAGAIALLDTALADSKRFFEVRPNGDLAYWSKSDAEDLTKLSDQVKGVKPVLPPEADWFKTGNTESPAIIAAIAAKLDAAWAIDEPLGASAGFRTYRNEMTRLYDQAIKSGNIAAAKHALALAAQGHSNGAMRSAATKALSPPPGFLWSWLDPDVKPN